MRDFEYETPTTLDAAIAVLAAGDGRARPLAGGTDLIDHIRTGRLTPSVVVDIKRIAELNVLECGPAGLRLGAAVSCTRLCAHAGIHRDYAALTDACSIIGGIQIQNRASVGGNLCTSGPAADSTPALIALGAVCHLAGPSGPRELPVEQFCTGKGTNVLGRGELLVELRVPPPLPRTGSRYERFIPRNEMDIAVVGVGAAVSLDPQGETITAARIGLGAVAPTPLLAADVSRWLVGRPATQKTFAEAAAACRQIISPIDDMRGTREFRIHVTGVLVERVLAEATRRVRASR
jgi:carbon-monoxide dehydrogenase medium subunit